MIDYDGKPTQWGRWHPEYVNQFPRQVGDRRLNSAEIIAFLQAAYHFTGKELYKQKAFELFDKHGYLDNITIPIKELSRVPGIDLTTEWNHSDDELAFLTYWNLYRYAFTDELREKYRQAIREHWEIERPEKNPLWNFIYADTGAKEFDLEESIWTLKEFPLDTISWTVRNSRRKDLEFLAPNFRAPNHEDGPAARRAADEQAQRQRLRPRRRRRRPRGIRPGHLPPALLAGPLPRRHPARGTMSVAALADACDTLLCPYGHTTNVLDVPAADVRRAVASGGNVAVRVFVSFGRRLT